jgi:hypothetical protein
MLWVLLLPYVVSFAGAASNQLVLIANNDTFPVRVNLVKVKTFVGDDAVQLPDGTVMLDDVHCLMSSKTHLNLLADNFDFRDDGIESIGDMLLGLGEWLKSFCIFVWVALASRALSRRKVENYA